MTKTIDTIRESVSASEAVESRKPIRYVTENGFSIVRRCDVDSSVSHAGKEHCFVVEDPDGYELEITVGINDHAVADAISRSRGKLDLDSTYWVACAERHLADYLWEHEDYPPDGQLTVNLLTLDDLDVARRWKDSTSSAVIPVSFSFQPDGHFSSRDGDESKPQKKSAPITLLTENGYTIVRRSEIDSSIKDDARLCRFTVEDPRQSKRDLCVIFDDEVIADIQRRRRNLPLSMQSKYWLVCAESQLAAYLWEHDQFPADGNLTISELPGDELLMAQHWRDAE